MASKVVIYHRPNMPHHIKWCGAFGRGLVHHGLVPDVRDFDDPIDCDLAVFWSHKAFEVRRRQKENQADYICLEAGFIDRYNYAHVGWNGLNRHADFKNQNVPADRAERFQHLLKPWKDGGEYTLIMGQVPGDASTFGADLESVWRDVCERARGLGIGIKYRPHPLVKQTEPLDVDLARAASVIIWNSNSGVDAVLAGVPTIALDEGAMAWPVSGHRVGEIVNPDRTEWFNELAYAQWNLSELSSGKCWDRIKPS